MKTINGLSVRVYGILLNEQQQVLVSDEFIRGGYYTKFPGGGLELGEGTIDCVVREWREEVDQDVEVLEHIYTTDFFQESAFRSNEQIIAIYYLLKATSPFIKPVLSKPFDFAIPEGQTQVEGVRWVNWHDFSAETVSLPIDKIVAKMVKEHY